MGFSAELVRVQGILGCSVTRLCNFACSIKFPVAEGTFNMAALARPGVFNTLGPCLLSKVGHDGSCVVPAAFVTNVSPTLPRMLPSGLSSGGMNWIRLSQAKKHLLLAHKEAQSGTENKCNQQACIPPTKANLCMRRCQVRC